MYSGPNVLADLKSQEINGHSKNVVRLAATDFEFLLVECLHLLSRSFLRELFQSKKDWSWRCAYWPRPLPNPSAQPCSSTVRTSALRRTLQLLRTAIRWSGRAFREVLRHTVRRGSR